jgi:interleukin-1 receptor-associated kinase 1
VQRRQWEAAAEEQRRRQEEATAQAAHQQAVAEQRRLELAAQRQRDAEAAAATTLRAAVAGDNVAALETALRAGQAGNLSAEVLQRGVLRLSELEERREQARRVEVREREGRHQAAAAQLAATLQESRITTGEAQSDATAVRLTPVPLSELVAATAGWAAARKVGEGGFGAVYRAEALPSRRLAGPVAIKRLAADSQQGLNELMSEVQLLGTCGHEHLLPLLAFCYEGGIGCLVYPLMAGGSLEDRLMRDADAMRRLSLLLPSAAAVPSPLTWPHRLRAVRDATRALLFLHTPTATRPVVLHRDIKPANVLLDAEGNAKLADGAPYPTVAPCAANPPLYACCACDACALRAVGLAKQVHELQMGRTHMTTRNLAGSVGYIDPLYADSGQYSQTTDAYAMGVLLLVCLSGRRAQEAKDTADDALEDLNDSDALQRALDPAAGWPQEAARQLMRIVKGLY